MKFNEETIFNYLDGNLTAKEVSLFEQELAQNKEFNALFTRISLLDETLKTSAPASPSPAFAERVMQSVSRTQTANAVFFNRQRLAAIGLIIFVITATLALLANHFYPAIDTLWPAKMTAQDFIFDLKPYTELLNTGILVKVMLYATALISLLLLDQAVLKPYFKQRKQRYAM